MIKTTQPALHGNQHLTHGSDPIPGMFVFTGRVDEVIRGTRPGAYYKLDETTGGWADSSGSDPPRDAVYISRGETRGTFAPLDEGDGAEPGEGKCVSVNGPFPVAALSPSNVAECTSSFFEFGGSAEMTVSALINLVPESGALDGIFSMGICGNVTNPTGGGWGLFLLSQNFDPDPIDDIGRGGKVCWMRSNTYEVVTSDPIGAGFWYRVTGTFDGTNSALYLDDTHIGTTPTSVSLPTGIDYWTFRIGDCGVAEGFGGNMAPFQGLIDSVVVWDRALTPGEVDAIVGAGEEGLVPGSDGSGGVVWTKPAIEVEF